MEASGLDSIGGLNLNGWSQEKLENDSNTLQDEPSAHIDTQDTGTGVAIAPQQTHQKRPTHIRVPKPSFPHSGDTAQASARGIAFQGTKSP